MPLRIPCPQCGRFPPPPCDCPPLPPPPPEPAAPATRKLYPEILKLRREKRGGGREVVIVEGFNPGTQIDLEALARELKLACGTGGTVKGRTIEIQGDHREKIAEVLLAHRFRSKRAGG
ncbi:MAG: translation initiation factor [Planctomycetes bacterium]|nr:translation initiation factor [Planctomycetota bacterium]